MVRSEEAKEAQRATLALARERLKTLQKPGAAMAE
jgi:hypothetical protein